MSDPLMAEDEPVFIYTTFENAEEAEQVGGSLVEWRLAACVNIYPGMISVYRWEGKIARGHEAGMIVKTRRGIAQAAMDALKELHPFDTPAIILLPTEGGDADFCRWISAETSEI